MAKMRNLSIRSSQVAKSSHFFPFGGGWRIKVPRSYLRVGKRIFQLSVISYQLSVNSISELKTYI